MHCSLATVADVALTPRVWVSVQVECESCELAASHLSELRQISTFDVTGDLLRVPLGLGVTVAGLAVITKTPCVHFTFVGKGGSVSEASGTRLDSNDLTVLVGREGNMLRQLNNLMLADSELTHASLTPSIHCTVVSDSEGVEGACRDVGHVEDAVLAVEEFHERGCCRNIDRLRQTQLAFIATTPSVEVAFVGHYHGVAVTTGNHCNALVSKGLQNLWFISRAGTTMA